MTKTSCIVVFGSNALTIKHDMQSIQENQVPLFDFVDLDDLYLEPVSRKYATFEEDFWFLDGSYKLMPEEPHVGYMTQWLSDSAGNFPLPRPELQIIFDDVHSTTDGLTFRFSEATQDWLSQFQIFYYNSVGGLIRSDTYNPTAAIFSTNQAVSNFKRIVIISVSTNNPYRFARITGIDFDTLVHISGDSVKEAHLVEQIDPSRVTLPFNTVDLVLLSEADEFNLASPSGYYANIQNYEPIEVYEQVDDDVIFIGLFYLEEWDSKSPNEATFKLIDAIGLMDTMTYLGGYTDYLNEAHWLAFFNSADLPYTLDSFLAAIGNTFALPGWVPITSFRKALQMKTFALATSSIQSYATCARSRTIDIRPITFAFNIVNPDYVITSDDKGLQSSLKLRPAVTRSEVTAYVYNSTGPSETIISETLAVGTHRILFSEPHTSLSVTGASIVASNYNYADLSVAVAGAVTLSGVRVEPLKKSFSQTNELLPGGTKENVVIVDNTAAHQTNAPNYAKMIINYYKQRYVEKARLYAPLLTVGNSVLIESQGEEVLGIVEKLTTDLANGFVADVDIAGVVLPSSIAKTVLSVGMFDNNDSRITYSTGWLNWVDASLYGGSEYYTDVAGSYFTFFMVGNRFRIYYASSSDKGSINVYVDTVLYATFSQYSASVIYNVYWESGVLSGGFHYIKVEKVNGNRGDVDAVEVI